MIHRGFFLGVGGGGGAVCGLFFFPKFLQILLKNSPS